MSVGIAELLLLGLMAATGIAVTAGVLVVCLATIKWYSRQVIVIPAPP